MASGPSSEPAAVPPCPEEEETKALSKKAEKKLKLKAEKEKRKQESAAAAAVSISALEIDDPLATNYGDVPLEDLQSKPVTGRVWTEVEALDEALEGKQVLVRGRAQTIRPVSKKMLFVVLRHKGFTAQCVLSVAKGLVSEQMVRFAAALSRESIVDIEGVVSVPGIEIKGATQQVFVFVLFFIIFLSFYRALFLFFGFFVIDMILCKLYCICVGRVANP